MICTSFCIHVILQYKKTAMKYNVIALTPTKSESVHFNYMSDVENQTLLVRV